MEVSYIGAMASVVFVWIVGSDEFGDIVYAVPMFLSMWPAFFVYFDFRAYVFSRRRAFV